MRFGLAVDYGTASLRAALIDPETGSFLICAERDNPLSVYGKDILARITECAESASRKEEICGAAAAGLRDLIFLVAEKGGIDPRDITDTVLAANTTHLYLLLRQDPACIMRPPYELPLHAPSPVTAADLALPVSGEIRFVPCKANYLGGDVLCTLLTAGFDHAEPGRAILDLGVNAELIVSGKDALYAGSCAAGCALDSADFSACELTHVINELYQKQVLNRRGRLIKGADPRLLEQASPLTGRPVLSLLWDERTLFQSDIASFLQAKASVANMIDYIFGAAGLSFDGADPFLLCGALGNALQLPDAVGTGLLPDRAFIKEKDMVLKGAAKLLLDPSAWQAAEEIYDRLHYVQLREVEDYLELMLSHLYLP